MNTHTEIPSTPYPARLAQQCLQEEERKKRKAANDRASKLRRKQEARDPGRDEDIRLAEMLKGCADIARHEETRREIYRIVHRLQTRAGSPDEKRLAVFARLDKWRETGLTEAELAEETGLTRADVRGALQALLAPVEIVECYTRGGRGRPVLYWRMKSAKF
jgi:hypothetical protein